MSTKKTPRYTLVCDQGYLLTDNLRGKVYSLAIDENMRHKLERLLHRLVGVANQGGSGSDPLFNCLESLDALFDFLKASFPPLLTSDVLHPLVDIRAAVHDKIVGARPPLLDGRVRGLDGSYRRMDEYPAGSFNDERKGLPTRPLRPYRYTLEARILIAFDALMRGHNFERTVLEFRKMLRTHEIMSQSYGPSRALLVEDVVSWWKVILKDESKPAAGRAYCFRSLQEKHAAELRSCADKATGCRFAATVLESVRTLQATNVSSGLSDWMLDTPE